MTRTLSEKMNTLFKAKDFLVHLSTFCKRLFFIFRWAVNGSLTSETYSFQRHERALCFRDWLMKRQSLLCTSKTRFNSSYLRKAEVSTKILHLWEFSWIFTEMQQASLKVTCYAHFQHPPLNYVYRWFFANLIHSSNMCFTLDLGCPLQTEGVNSRLLCSQTEVS